MKWETWIGANWHEIPEDKRLLVIGESHFLDGEDSRERIEHSQFLIRNVKQALEGERVEDSRDYFTYIIRCLSSNINPDLSVLDNIAYNVIIQEPLKNSSARPSSSQFREGWFNTFDEINRLKVSECLFIGVGAANYFNSSCKSIFQKGEFNLKYFEKIKGCRPRVASLTTSKFDTRFLFIRHAGRGGYKYWKEWNEFLVNENLRF